MLMKLISPSPRPKILATVATATLLTLGHGSERDPVLRSCGRVNVCWRFSSLETAIQDQSSTLMCSNACWWFFLYSPLSHVSTTDDVKCCFGKLLCFVVWMLRTRFFKRCMKWNRRLYGRYCTHPLGSYNPLRERAGCKPQTQTSAILDSDIWIPSITVNLAYWTLLILLRIGTTTGSPISWLIMVPASW